MTTQYTYEEIRELYHKTSTDSYKDRENKEWLPEEQHKEWKNAYLTLCKIRRNLDCQMNQRLMYLRDIQILYQRMCEDIRGDLKQ